MAAAHGVDVDGAAILSSQDLYPSLSQIDSHVRAQLPPEVLQELARESAARREAQGTKKPVNPFTLARLPSASSAAAVPPAASSAAARRTPPRPKRTHGGQMSLTQLAPALPGVDLASDPRLAGIDPTVWKQLHVATRLDVRVPPACLSQLPTLDGCPPCPRFYARHKAQLVPLWLPNRRWCSKLRLQRPPLLQPLRRPLLQPLRRPLLRQHVLQNPRPWTCRRLGPCHRGADQPTSRCSGTSHGHNCGSSCRWVRRCCSCASRCT